MPQSRVKFSLKTVQYLQKWLEGHKDNPYPSPSEKKVLCAQAKVSERQLNVWFTNARKRRMSPINAWLSDLSGEDGASQKDTLLAARGRLRR